MIYKLYSLKDAKTGFLAPSLEVSDTIAIRNLENALALQKESNGILFTHARDFTLFDLGTFDSNSGALIVNSSPIHVCDLEELKGVL